VADIQGNDRMRSLDSINQITAQLEHKEAEQK
jgi:hypothetical protein